MKSMKTILLGLATAAILCGPAAAATGVTRLDATNAMAPFAEITAVPPGYTTYYISGSTASPMTPAAGGKPAVWGDISYQTKSTLDNLTKLMANAGLTFGDIVAAHV